MIVVPVTSVHVPEPSSMFLILSSVDFERFATLEEFEAVTLNLYCHRFSCSTMEDVEAFASISESDLATLLTRTSSRYV